MSKTYAMKQTKWKPRTIKNWYPCTFISNVDSFFWGEQRGANWIITKFKKPLGILITLKTNIQLTSRVSFRSCKKKMSASWFEGYKLLVKATNFIIRNPQISWTVFGARVKTPEYQELKEEHYHRSIVSVSVFWFR